MYTLSCGARPCEAFDIRDAQMGTKCQERLPCGESLLNRSLIHIYVEVNDAVVIYGNIAPRSALFLGIAYLVAGAALGLMACRGSGMVPVVIGIIGCLLYTSRQKKR